MVKCGLRASCKGCDVKYELEHHKLSEKYKDYCRKIRGSEEYKEYQRKYRKEYTKSDKFKKYNKEYQSTDKSREHRREYQKVRLKVRMATDLYFRIARLLRIRFSIAIRNNQKSGSAVRDLGCTIEFFKVFIEKQFKSGMSWDNWGKWHLDHKVALRNKDIDLTKREDILKVLHYTNYQPLWAIDNIRKSNT